MIRQAEIYRKLIEICIEEENCKNWTVWGFTDAVTFLSDSQDGLLWDKDFMPKLAQEYVLEALQAAHEEDF